MKKLEGNKKYTKHVYRNSLTERRLKGPKLRRVDNIRISIAEMYSQVLEHIQLIHRLQWKFFSEL
jgi:hypothetical protein